MEKCDRLPRPARDARKEGIEARRDVQAQRWEKRQREAEREETERERQRGSQGELVRGGGGVRAEHQLFLPHQ
jgi:hypothetical protein